MKNKIYIVSGSVVLVVCIAVITIFLSSFGKPEGVNYEGNKSPGNTLAGEEAAEPTVEITTNPTEIRQILQEKGIYEEGEEVVTVIQVNFAEDRP